MRPPSSVEEIDFSSDDELAANLEQARLMQLAEEEERHADQVWRELHEEARRRQQHDERRRRRVGRHGQRRVRGRRRARHARRQHAQPRHDL